MLYKRAIVSLFFLSVFIIDIIVKADYSQQELALVCSKPVDLNIDDDRARYFLCKFLGWKFSLDGLISNNSSSPSSSTKSTQKRPTTTTQWPVDLVQETTTPVFIPKRCVGRPRVDNGYSVRITEQRLHIFCNDGYILVDGPDIVQCDPLTGHWTRPGSCY